MTSNLTAVILVQDTVGYKNDSVIKNKWKWYLGTSQSTVHVRRGELLKEYHHEEKKYNYVLQRDPSVFLRCADENVAPLLTQKEFMLMEGIEKPVDRFGAFIEGMIEFGMSLEPGSRVFVNIGTKDRRLIRAIVHYIGEVLGGQGCHFGVELKEKVEGGHNGIVSGFFYFHCEDGCGKFVPLNKLVKYTDERYSRQSSSSSQDTEKTSMRSINNSSHHTDDLSKNTHSKPNPENQKSLSMFKIGDRVRFYDKQGQSSKGTVMWIGTSSRSRNSECVYVGIITDNEVYTVDYEKSVPGLGHLISAALGRSLFIPESMVDEIEQRESKRDMKDSLADQIGEEIIHHKPETVDERQNFFEQAIRKKKKEQNELEVKLKLAGETSSSLSEAMKTKSTDSHVSHLEIILKEKEDTISKLIGEVKHQKEELAKLKQSYEAKLHENEENLKEKKEMLWVKEEMLQEHKEKLKEKEKLLQKNKEKLQKNEEMLQEKEEEITGHLKAIEKLNEKLKAYDNIYDESWIQVSQNSVPSWKIDRCVLKRISQTQLGVGAWGVVYSAEFKGEQVAIKHAHRELLRIQGTVQMVKREISILAHIHHPNLVRFIGAVLDSDVESKRDVPIIVLELLDMNLRTAYTDVSLDQSIVASIFCDVAYALHYLHEQTTPIIHRDVSAPNILLKKLPNHFYRAKVSDFGSANLARQSITAGAGAIIYTAPEMFPQEDVMAEQPEQTVKVDVYSFGIVMLEVVCREMPVPEKRRALLRTCESRWKVIYDLVRQCTRASPRDRPAMREILHHICRI